MASSTVNRPVSVSGHTCCGEARPALVSAAAAMLLDQCAAFIQKVEGGAYVADSGVIKGGSIGKHIRHTLDHFRAVMDGMEPGGVVDYDNRSRNVPMETDAAAALVAIGALRERLLKINENEVGTSVVVRVTLTSDGAQAELESTLGRELAFAAHHAIHHHAMLGAMAAEFGAPVDPEFGKAPSTIIHESRSSQNSARAG